MFGQFIQLLVLCLVFIFKPITQKSLFVNCMLYYMFCNFVVICIYKNCIIVIEFMYVINVYLALVLKHDVPKLISLLSILT